MDLADIFAADAVEATTPADYNVAPTKPVPVVLSRTREAGTVRTLTVADWGLPRHGNPGAPLFNLRAETVLERAPFARLLKQQRCLIPADGYYEWQHRPDGRQPYFVAPADDGVLPLAGLYAYGAGGRPACVILTSAATGEHAWLHPRSPLAVPTEAWDDWVAPGRSAFPLTELVPVTALPLRVHPVSRAVNHVANGGPALIRAAPAPAEQATLW